MAVSTVYWTANLQLHQLPLLSPVSDKRNMMWCVADALQKLQTEYHVHSNTPSISISESINALSITQWFKDTDSIRDHRSTFRFLSTWIHQFSQILAATSYHRRPKGDMTHFSHYGPQIFGANGIKFSHQSDGARNLYTPVQIYHIRYRHVSFLNARSKDMEHL